MYSVLQSQHKWRQVNTSQHKSWSRYHTINHYSICSSSITFDLFTLKTLSHMHVHTCTHISALGNLPKQYDRGNLGLYRDDGLAVSERYQVVQQNTPRRILLNPLTNLDSVLPFNPTLELPTSLMWRLICVTGSTTLIVSQTTIHCTSIRCRTIHRWSCDS